MADENTKNQEGLEDDNRIKECDNDCSNCPQASGCTHVEPADKTHLHQSSNIKTVIAVMSGKGGVGKTQICSILASKLQKAGYSVGILDADITGPSIPKLFGIAGPLLGNDAIITPRESKGGIKVVSTALMLETRTTPVAWRGPIISGVIGQFYGQTFWGDLDVLLVDMPPGTSDVFLTVMNTLPVDGAICVSSPQDLVGQIARKAINLAYQMTINVIGAVENMSYFECDQCHKKHEIYGKSQISGIVREYKIKAYDRVPINPELTKFSDRGKLEEFNLDDYANKTFNAAKKLIDFKKSMFEKASKAKKPKTSKTKGTKSTKAKDSKSSAAKKSKSSATAKSKTKTSKNAKSSK